MNREEMLARVRARSGAGQRPWDLLIIGGGATGVGCAVDAAARGYEVLLLEQHDFGKGTSSRSTKLVHGGVRYLEQGNLALVLEALKERGRLRQNAPHLVKELGFVVPHYLWWEAPFYGLGLKLYQWLAGRHSFGASQLLSPAETLARLPNLRGTGLRGGVSYYDGQFDDARLLINLAQTAVEQGATLLNYTEVVGLTRAENGAINGAHAREVEGGEELHLRARLVLNATGAFCDRVRQMADKQTAPLVAPSQGIHLVFDGSFLPGGHALMVPRTIDRRVMFAIPWHAHTLVGTTDTPVNSAELEPRPLDREIDFILETAGRYLQKRPTREDVLSVFAGIRPLVKAGGKLPTSALSRDHTLHSDQPGLLTITGGKWTTYRRMAEDCVNHAARLAQLPTRACRTKELKIHGYHLQAADFGPLAIYGADAPAILELIKRDASLGERLHPDLPYCGAEVIWAVRHEMARTVEDVLARRTRALFLNAKAACTMASRVAALMAQELNQTAEWQEAQIKAFNVMAAQYSIR